MGTFVTSYTFRRIHRCTMQGSSVFLLLTLSPALFNLGECSSSAAKQAIVEKLLRKGPLNLVPPDGPDDNSPVMVSLGYSLTSISGQDLVLEGLATTGYLMMEWQDPRLAFASYSGVTAIRIDVSHIWTPDIELYNTIDPGLRILNRQNTAVVYNTGNVYWVPIISTRTLCVPGEDSGLVECSLKFGSWTHSGHNINLTVSDGGVDLSDLTPNPRINLTSATAGVDVKYYTCCPEPYISAFFNFTLQPLF